MQTTLTHKSLLNNGKIKSLNLTNWISCRETLLTGPLDILVFSTESNTYLKPTDNYLILKQCIQQASKFCLRLDLTSSAPNIKNKQYPMSEKEKIKHIQM